MKIIGLTGGIASGKSTVSKMLKELGAFIIDADIIARDIVTPGCGDALIEIVNHFGKGILNIDGTLNRKLLGNIIFQDDEKRNLLNNITHPRVIREIQKEIDKINTDKPDAIIFIDAPLLFEAGLNDMMDEVWLVYVDRETQIRRLMKRDSINLSDAKARISSQMSLDEKIKISDRIIYNNKDMGFTEAQVRKLWQYINSIVWG